MAAREIITGLCLSLLPSYCAQNPLEQVYFFNVGQGHCVLATFKDSCPLLIDAGSNTDPIDLRSLTAKPKKASSDQSAETSDNPMDDYVFKALKKQEAATKIIRIIEESSLQFKKGNDYDLRVFISHGDTDHYNLLPLILQAPLTLPKKVFFLLGGKKNDYEKAFQDYVEQFRTAPNQKMYVEDYRAVKDESFMQRVPCGEHASYQVLAADLSGDKNQDSLIVRVTYRNGSVLLTGDATAKTTKAVMQAFKDKPAEIKIDILQAAHHGADSDGSNAKGWIKQVNPGHFIISAGIHRGFKHPQSLAIMNALDASSSALNCGEAKYHTLYYGGNALDCESQFITFASDRNGYHHAITTYNIRSTACQGDIAINMDHITISSQNPLVPSENTRNALLFQTVKNSFYFEFLVHLRLKDYGLTDEGFAQIAPLKFKFLENTDLRGNKLENTEQICMFIINHINMKQLRLEQNPLAADEAKTLVVAQAWGCRGLRFN